MSASRRIVLFALLLVTASVVRLIFIQSEEKPWRFDRLFRLSTHKDTWWTVDEALKLPQAAWRNWLGRQKLSSGDHLTVGHVNKQDCGFTMHLNYQTNNNGKRKVFFKFASTHNIENHYAETHLREIKAAYLDRILGTQVIPPCTGYRFNYQDVHDRISSGNATETDRLQLHNAMLCAGQNTTLEGSVHFFVPGVTLTSKDEILRVARLYNSSNDDKNQESAMRVILFVYLAGCIKSGHNHFMVNDRFVAIDNDKCFMPEHLLNKKKKKKPYTFVSQAEQLLFETCDFPVDVMKRMGELAQKNHTLSDQLQASLQEDVLAIQLLQEQPQALLEMDIRAQRLWEHVRTCRRRSQNNTT